MAVEPGSSRLQQPLTAAASETLRTSVIKEMCAIRCVRSRSHVGSGSNSLRGVAVPAQRDSVGVSPVALTP